MDKELLLRINNILVNLSFLIGEKLAWVSEKVEVLKEMILAFIQGFTNARVSNI
jgi:hypothetical protein